MANQVWGSNIPYLPLASGQWAYRCAFQDACTRQVVGGRVPDTMPEELVSPTVRQVLLARQPAPGLLVHSDRGGRIVPTLTGPCSTSTPTCAHKVAGPSERAGWEPLVAARNRGVTAARVACFPRPGGRAVQRSNSF